MPVQPADSGGALADIHRHHQKLHDRMTALAEAVYEAAEDGEADTEAVAMFSWYRSDLLPHFKAEEAAIYARGREREATALVVQGLLGDHAELRGLLEDMDVLDGPIEAVVAAGKAQVLLAAHIRREEELLLPALAQAGVDLSEAAAGRHELVGGERTAAATPTAAMSSGVGSGEHADIEPIAGREELDVRSLSHQQRHGVILGKMKALTDQGMLILINDHDPKPLRYQADEFWPGQFEWTYLDEGPEAWRIAITRV